MFWPFWKMVVIYLKNYIQAQTLTFLLNLVLVMSLERRVRGIQARKGETTSQTNHMIPLMDSTPVFKRCLSWKGRQLPVLLQSITKESHVARYDRQNRYSDFSLWKNDRGEQLKGKNLLIILEEEQL